MENKNTIRVRFAPSPTGYLHIGGLRTALFNYLFARHNKGNFILRIEDTDQTRKVEGALENLIKTLSIMGLEYDEGPNKGGEYGPYFQSQRLDIYKKYADQLLASGHAYYAFETQEELDEMRKIQQIQGFQTMYDRRGRELNSDEVKEKLNKHIPHVVRLKVPLNTEIKFDDLIRGTVKIDTNLIDDQVLIKSDGFPTYHLANVVDDHLMKITHVIRGEEWLTSVPKHIILYNALGWDVPQLAHVPLILNPDKTKLSKRQGDVATEDFLNKGYLPEALLNFIALLGWNPGEGENREIFSKEELITLFSLDKINSSGAIFNIEKLKWMNGEYIKKMRTEKENLKRLDELLKPYYEKYEYGNWSDSTTGMSLSLTANTSNLDEAGKMARVVYPLEINLTSEELNFIAQESSQKILKKLYDKIQKIDSTVDISTLVVTCRTIIKEIQTETKIKGQAFYHPIRLVLSGQDHGPELAQYICDRLDNLGTERVLDMIGKYIK